MSELVGNHIVGFPMRRLNYHHADCATIWCILKEYLDVLCSEKE